MNKEEFERLVKQCMDSGWFTSEENARRYVERYCSCKRNPTTTEQVCTVMPKKVDDVIEKWNLESDVIENSEEGNKEPEAKSSGLKWLY